jgi:hypothetical protein
MMAKKIHFYEHLQIRDNELLNSQQRVLGIAEATIEDLAFGICSSREPDEVGRRVCLSEASYAAAEKSEWRMALKIRWERGYFPKPFFIFDFRLLFFYLYNTLRLKRR